MQLVRQSLHVKSARIITCIVSVSLALLVCRLKYILTSLHAFSYEFESSGCDKIQRLCSAQTVTRIGLLEEIPRSGVQIPCLS
jgi:hypothetical protein